MQYTNKKGLSDEIANAIIERMGKYDRTRSGYSVTQIIDSPQVVRLTKQHEEDLEADVHDLLDAWQGHLLHDALERDETSYRLAYEFGGTTLTGAQDRFKGGELKDYKRTSVWSIIYGSSTKKWEEQLNCYAFLLREHGEEVTSCGIEVFLKDWSAMKAKFDLKYPQARQYYIKMPLWDQEKATAFVHERLRLHIEDAGAACTAEDMWEKPTKYALMKKGRKSAVKLFDDENDLVVHCKDKNLGEHNGEEGWEFFGGHYMDTRKGERTRCQDWCDVAPFCPQWKEYCADQAGGDS